MLRKPFTSYLTMTFWESIISNDHYSTSQCAWTPIIYIRFCLPLITWMKPAKETIRMRSADVSHHLIITTTYAAATIRCSSTHQYLVLMTERKKRDNQSSVSAQNIFHNSVTSPHKKQNTHRQEHKFCKSHADYANSLFMMYFIHWCLRGRHKYHSNQCQMSRDIISEANSRTWSKLKCICYLYGLSN